MIAPGTEGDRGVFGFKRKPSEPGRTLGGETDGGEDGEVLRECGARFSTNQHLKRHMESHMKTFPHIVSYLRSALAESFHTRLILSSSVLNIHHAQPDSENVVHCAVTSARFISMLYPGLVGFRILMIQTNHAQQLSIPGVNWGAI